MAFADRSEAGRRLAASLAEFAGQDVVVLGLPRGGVVVAAEVADALGAPLDVIVVRKLGFPSQPELAMGAIGEGGAKVVNVEGALLARRGSRGRGRGGALRAGGAGPAGSLLSRGPSPGSHTGEDRHSGRRRHRHGGHDPGGVRSGSGPGRGAGRGGGPDRPLFGGRGSGRCGRPGGLPPNPAALSCHRPVVRRLFPDTRRPGSRHIAPAPGKHRWRP